ncbi:DNA repair protein SWI5 homolog [Manacus vitellinus]|uniref:DNA repair protein SWI5 homolog n=1 Tax=Manacus vitellinus TaxID=328815 RepID=UPI00115D1E48|nr:DNA repair protein SWI5 homolog [Manacus vitellinus]
MLHRPIPVLLKLPTPCPGDIFFPFFLLFYPAAHTLFSHSCPQHCSVLSRAELLLNIFCALQVPSSSSFQPNGASEAALRCEIEELKRKDLALDQEIAQLLSEGYSLGELEKHISLLHEYNEIKDAGQMLLGKLAVIRGVTTKELYPEYDLELSD